MSSADHAVYVRPAPEQVARIVGIIGLDAACERWWYLDRRTLGSLARVGRARATGTATKNTRPRSYTDEDAAVAVEAAHALGSMDRGERAVGLRLNALRNIFEARGLPFVILDREERGRFSGLCYRANRGDEEAAAAVEAQYRLARAVAEVIRRAIRIVPEQPATGRYAMPARGPELDAALRGLDPLAIAMAFPAPVPERRKPGRASTVDVEEIVARYKAGEKPAAIAAALRRGTVTVYDALRRAGVEFTWRKLPADTVIRREILAGLSQHAIARKYGTTRGAVSHRIAAMGLQGKSRVPRTTRKIPDDDAIRADVAAGMSRNALATRYGVSRSVVNKHVRRLGLQTRGWGATS